MIRLRLSSTLLRYTTLFRPAIVFLLLRRHLGIGDLGIAAISRRISHRANSSCEFGYRVILPSQSAHVDGVPRHVIDHTSLGRGASDNGSDHLHAEGPAHTAVEYS